MIPLFNDNFFNMDYSRKRRGGQNADTANPLPRSDEGSEELPLCNARETLSDVISKITRCATLQ